MGYLNVQNISDDHPSVEILHHLENWAYSVGENMSVYIVRLARCIIQTILRWANKLNGRLKVGALCVL